MCRLDWERLRVPQEELEHVAGEKGRLERPAKPPDTPTRPWISGKKMDG